MSQIHAVSGVGEIPGFPNHLPNVEDLVPLDSSSGAGNALRMVSRVLVGVIAGYAMAPSKASTPAYAVGTGIATGVLGTLGLGIVGLIAWHGKESR